MTRARGRRFVSSRDFGTRSRALFCREASSSDKTTRRLRNLKRALRRARDARQLTTHHPPSPRLVEMGAGQSTPADVLAVRDQPVNYVPPLEVNPANPKVILRPSARAIRRRDADRTRRHGAEGGRHAEDRGELQAAVPRGRGRRVQEEPVPPGHPAVHVPRRVNLVDRSFDSIDRSIDASPSAIGSDGRRLFTAPLAPSAAVRLPYRSLLPPLTKSRRRLHER